MLKTEVETYTLSLTGDELTWLFEVLADAHRTYAKQENGLDADLRVIRKQWLDQLWKQGWLLF